MLDLAHKISALKQRQSELDDLVSTADSRLDLLLNEQMRDADPTRRALAATIARQYLSLGDLLYQLGEVSARLDDAESLAGALNKAAVSTPILQKLRLRSAATGASPKAV